MNSDTSSNSPFPTSGSAGSTSGSSLGGSGLGGSGSGSGSMSAGAGSSGVSAIGTAPDMDSEGTVHRMAQKVHEAVDRLEQTLGSGSERMMGMQQEYGEKVREQVHANPLAAVGVAFGIGVIFAKLFMR
jgi:ElaB/YqjD/DUF883 family membrane-anchored ribosome-binding protein